MTEYIYTETEVREMWKRPKEEQYSIAQAKCIEAIVRTKGELAIAFSGGKDSAVLLFIMAQMWAVTYQQKPLRVFFANTTNEFVCAQKYRKEYISWIKNKFNITVDYRETRADDNYFNVVDIVGLPFISKKVSRMIRDCKETLKRLGLRYADIEKYMPKHYTKNHIEEMIKAAEHLRALGFNDTVILNLTKIRSDNHIGLRFLPVRYRPILDNDDIELSEKCCEILKKGPLGKMQKEMGGLLSVTGEMAEDSRDRMEAYRITGCNMFEGNHKKSKPLGPMTEQTVLWIIKTYEIPIMPVYGKCECCGLQGISETYELTGEKRTGCKLCGFGIAYDPNRFIRLATLEPKVAQFAFTSRKNGGLGYREVCIFLNEKCGMNIGIPDIQEGFYEKRAMQYKKQLEKKEGQE
jgi:3'-phosphoadenosine 5'-phosphosulfate sulfotransferase (PAPS reductase)/FAD synthetase